MTNYQKRYKNICICVHMNTLSENYFTCISYECVYVYIYIYIHTYMCICMYVCVYIYMYITCIYIHTKLTTLATKQFVYMKLQ